ncbi:WecB/TagA/CpsF family glycosyltransferase [Pseudoalteromonas sp. T1lg65]|uniref:WecB/TagA/CpsF family glycosyltransferase n=1 Tax=Pseudoalteromonas sp. T1lg65 TaxID=2077101 RepID=UPI003F79CCF5
MSSKTAFDNLLGESINGLTRSIAVTFVNPFSYSLLSKNARLLSGLDVVFSDGSLHTKLHNTFNHNKIQRLSFDFSSIAVDVLKFANETGKSIAFIGAKPGLVDTAVKNYQSMFPNLNVVYQHHGYLNSSELKQQVVAELNIKQPEIIVCGMGTPRQDEFIVELKSELKTPALLFTCGGFIEQSAIKADYYHPLIKKLGLRWLQRAVLHKHVRRRLVKEYPKFVFSYLRVQMKNKRIQSVQQANPREK